MGTTDLNLLIILNSVRNSTYVNAEFTSDDTINCEINTGEKMVDKR